MNAFQMVASRVSGPVIERLGWVLVHSLWQFAVVAALAGITVLALRRRSASSRYGVLVAALAVAVMAPVATWAWLPVDPGSGVPISKLASEERGSTQDAQSPILKFERPTPTSAVESADGPAVLGKAPPVEHIASRRRVTDLRRVADVPPSQSWWQRWELALRPWLAWIVVGWSVGVLLCSLRPLLGWHMLRRLKRLGVSPVSAEVVATLRRVSARLGLRCAVRVMQSTLTRVPVVVGYLRPVILLPVSLLTSIPPAQLEAILAHELAHVRRHDFIVNLLQTLVETFFFYHPAVWWLSHQTRVEREHCCDDLVVGLLGNRVEYGRALLAVEELRGESSLLALGVTDGSLLSRVRRIVGFKSTRTANSPWSAISLIACCLGGIMAMSILGWQGEAATRRETPKADRPVVDLPGGMRVEFVGLAVMGAENEKWWQPDGTLLDKAPNHKFDGVLSVGDRPMRRALIRVHGAKNYLDVTANISGSRVDEAHGSGGPFVAYAGGVPVEPGQTTTKLEVGVATEPLSPVRILNPAGERLRPPGLVNMQDHIAEDIQVVRVGHPRLRAAGDHKINGTPVPLTPAQEAENEQRRLRTEFAFIPPQQSKQLDFQLTLIDKAGKVHHSHSQEYRAASPQVSFVFDVPAEQVARFEYRMRLYRHWVTFDNVSLLAGKPTALKVTTQSLPPAKPTGYIAALPNGLTVEFVGITKNTAPAKEGWKPDGQALRDDVGYWPSTTVLHSKNTSASYTENGPHPEPDSEALDLLFRIRGLKAQPSITFDLATNGTSHPQLPVKDPYELRVSTRRRGQPSPGAKWTIPDGEMRVGLTDEPWGRYVKISPEGKVIDPIQLDEPYASTYKLIEVVGSKPHDRIPTGTAIVLRQPLHQADPENPLRRHVFEFRAVDTEGNPHWALEWEGRGIERTNLKESNYGLASPGLPAGKTLSHYEYRVRPYQHWVTFQGVSLDPGRESDVRIKVESLPAEPQLSLDGRKRLELAKSEYEKALATNRVIPGTISETELARLKLHVDAAEAGVVVVTKPGHWKLEGIESFEISSKIVHAADVLTTAKIRWPAKAGSPAKDQEILIAGDAFGSRTRWAVGWGEGVRSLWVVTMTGDDAEIHRFQIGEDRTIRESSLDLQSKRPIAGLEMPESLARMLDNAFTDRAAAFEPFECNIVDAVTGKPVSDTTTSFLFIKPKSGAVAETTVAHLVWGPKGPGRIAFQIPESIRQRPDLDELEVQWGTGNHPDYENLSPAARIPLRALIDDESTSARNTLRTIKLTPKKRGIDPSRELAALQGTWCFDVLQFRVWPEPIGIGTDGNGRNSEKRWTIKGNEITWTSMEGEPIRVHFTIDPSKTPKQIDFTFLNGPHKGGKCLGIYEPQQGNANYLWLCLTNPGADAPRPTNISYSSHGQQSMIGIYPVPAPEKQPVARSAARFHGMWMFKNCLTESWPIPIGKGPDKSGEGSEQHWVVTDNEITWTSPAGEEIKASFMIDSSKSPQQIDLTFLSGPQKGETSAGLLQRGDVDEDVIWLCLSDPGSKSPRPASFSFEKGKKRSLISLYPLDPSVPQATVDSPPMPTPGVVPVTPTPDNGVAKELEPFQGVWPMDICDSGNQTLYAPQKVVNTWRWVVTGNQITWTRSDGEVWHLTFSVDPAKTPKEIDLTYLDGPFKGQTCLGMYEWGGVSKNMLLISIQDPGAKVARPKEIRMTGTGQTSLIFLNPREKSVPPQNVNVGPPTATSWPSFRHDLAQSGVATSPLPEKLELLWEAQLGDQVSGTAAIVGNHVYVGCLSGELVCFDRGSGGLNWTYRSEKAGPTDSYSPGFKSSPTVTATTVYVGDEAGVFHAIDRAGGKARWTYKTNAELVSAAAVSGGRVLFGSYNNHLYCLDEATGQLVWKLATEGYVHAAPSVVGGQAFFACCDKHLRIVDIATGKVQSSIPVDDYLVGSPVVVGDHVYLTTFGGQVIAVDRATSKIVWSQLIATAEFPIQGSVAVVGNLVVVGAHDKQVHALDRVTGKPVWTHATGEKIDGSPVIVGQRLFIGSQDGHLYELELATGKLRWKFDVGDPLTASPAVGEGVLVIGSEGRRGRVVCFGERRVAAKPTPERTLEGTPLADAVRDFNADNMKRGIGKDQPPLTEDEVFAAIKKSEWKRDAADASEQEFADFKAIAETRRLPKGASLEVLTGLAPDAFTLIDLWSIRIYTPARERPGVTGFIIRNTVIREERIDPRAVAWGKPYVEGLSIGLFLLPKQEKYQIGDRVQLRLFVRNDGKQAVKDMTFWNITWPVPEDFTVTDQTDAPVVVRNVNKEWSQEKWIAGAMAGALSPGGVHGFRVPFELSIGGDGASKEVGRIIDARPGQTLKMRVRTSTGSGRERAKNEPEPESGTLTLQVAGNPAAAALPTDPKPADNSGVQAHFPPLEFRFVANLPDSKFEPKVPVGYETRQYPNNSVIGRMVAKDRGFIWCNVQNPKEANVGLPIERGRGELRDALVADTDEHALAWNLKWHVEECRAVPDANSKGIYSINLRLNEAGGKALQALTKSHLNQQLAIIVDGEIITAPTVRNEVGREILITGNFNRAAAERLAKLLKAGIPLPPELKAPEPSAAGGQADKQAALPKGMMHRLEGKGLQTEGHPSPIYALRFVGPSGIVGTSDNDARVWDWKPSQPRVPQPTLTLPHAERTIMVRGLAVSPDGSRIVTSSFDDSVRVWDRTKGEQLFQLKGHGTRGGIRIVRFKPDGGQFVSWGDDGILRWWNTANGTLAREAPVDLPGYIGDEAKRPPFGYKMTQAFSADAKSLFVVFEGALMEFDTTTGKRIRTAPIDENTVVLAVSPDGKWIAAGEHRYNKQGNLASSNVLLLDRATLRMVRQWPVADPRNLQSDGSNPDQSFVADNDNGMVFSPDSKLLAWSRMGKLAGIDIVEVDKDRMLTSIPVESLCYSLEFSSDGKTIASGHKDGTVCVWNRYHPVFVARPVVRDGRWAFANRIVRVRVVDKQDGTPIEGVVVEAERWDGPRQYEVDGVHTTDKDGFAEFTGLDAIDYQWETLASKPLPYVPSTRNTGPDEDDLTIKLPRACELILRAVDAETGRGIPGVLFGRERALAEYWLQDIVDETLELAENAVPHARRTDTRAGLALARERQAKQALLKKSQSYVTDADGYYRCLVDGATWSYSVAEFPKGYSSVVPIKGLQETEIPTPSGGKVEYTFKLVKAKPKPAEEPNEPTEPKSPPTDKPAGDQPQIDPKLGVLSGRFIYDGEPPVPRELHRELVALQADSQLARDELGRVSGYQMGYLSYLQKKIRPKTVDQSLLVGKEGGIANVLVWVEDKNIPWKSPVGEQPPVTIQLRDGNLSPRMTVVQIGQTLRLESHDPVHMNLRAQPFGPLNQAFNVGFQSDRGITRHEVRFKEQDKLPIKVQSDVGAWTDCYLFIRGTPYVAVSSADGSFSIPNLPPGEWEFKVWHEHVGWVRHWPQGSFKQTIQRGENSLGTIKLKPRDLARP